MNRRGVYLVPSLITLANLAAGVMSILYGAQGHFTRAAWCIIVAITLDVLDGRIARWTGGTSQFGLELDSLCDLVSFGVAPAILMYFIALELLNRPGYAIAVFFVLMAAVRLARYNIKTQTDAEPATHFVGLPVPAAAGVLASFVLSYQLLEVGEPTVKTIPLLMKRLPLFFQSIPVVMLVLSFLMVSTIQYGNFRRLKLGRPKSLQGLVMILAAGMLIVAYPQNTLFFLGLIYVLSGLINYFWRMRSQSEAVRRLRLEREGGLSRDPRRGLGERRYTAEEILADRRRKESPWENETR